MEDLAALPWLSEKTEDKLEDQKIDLNNQSGKKLAPQQSYAQRRRHPPKMTTLDGWRDQAGEEEDCSEQKAPPFAMPLTYRWKKGLKDPFDSLVIYVYILGGPPVLRTGCPDEKKPKI